MKKNLKKIDALIQIMDELREKCPWDKKQTMLSLRTNTIEECFELTDAILSQEHNDIKEELGDLLLHIVFYSKIASEENAFNFGDVVQGVCEKLIYRHPHIYSDTVANTPEEVKANWEALKQKKKTEGTLSGVPRSMPALPKATRIGEKVASVGFDWQSRDEVWHKVEEEITELKNAIRSKEQDNIEEEFGDLLFSITNAARLYNVDPETALERTNKKFIERFNYIEQRARLNGRVIQDLSIEEMEELWQEAKEKL